VKGTVCVYELSPSHTGPATRLRLPATEIAGKSHDLSQWIERPVAEVVGGRKSIISRSKVNGHVQNFCPAIPNRKRSQTDLIWSYDQSRMDAPPLRLLLRPVVGHRATGGTRGRAITNN
jgi:hypothetical protein